MSKFCSVGKERDENGEIIVCEESRAKLLPILQNMQQEKGYISDEDMQSVADELGIHPVEVYSVVTFYSFLSVEKKGEHIIRISNCISNIMAGSKEILKQFERILNIKVGETTSDGKFTLEETACIGMCDMAPAVMVDDKLIGNVTPRMVKKIIKEHS